MNFINNSGLTTAEKNLISLEGKLKSAEERATANIHWADLAYTFCIGLLFLIILFILGGMFFATNGEISPILEKCIYLLSVVFGFIFGRRRRQKVAVNQCEQFKKKIDILKKNSRKNNKK